MRCADCRAPMDTWDTACAVCGAPPGPPATGSNAASRARSAADPAADPGRSGVRWWPWLVGLLVIAVFGSGATWMVLGGPPRTPEGIVLAYFAALADRDAYDARAMVARSEGEKVETILLDDETLEHAEYTPPSDVSILSSEVEPSGRTANVQARYKIAGVTYERELRLARETANGPWYIFRGWGYLPANTRTSFPLIIAGTRVAKSDSPRVPAFLGAYVIHLAKHPLVEAAPVTAVAGEAHAPALQLRLRGERQGELERQVREHLDSCAERSDPQPPGCPFERDPDVQYPPAVLRTITQYPTLRLSVDGGGTITVMGEGPGRVDVTDPAATGSARLVARESFTVVGSLTIMDDDRVTFTPP